MKEIRLGTIGSGTIVHSILDGIRATDGIVLEAVYSRSLEKGEKLAAEYGASKTYANLDDMLHDSDVNFVYVASPNSLHYEQTRRALLAGKNVLCEKPFCARKEQAEELVALAKERHLFLIDATPTAFLPNFEILRREIPKIGRIRIVQSCYCQYSSRYDQLLAGNMTNVFNPEFAGGCLQDINYYNIYLNVALFGVPTSATYAPNLCASGVDSSGIALLQYSDFVSECTGAKDTWGVNSVQIQGENGFVYVEGGPQSIQRIRVETKQGDAVYYDEQPNPSRWFYEVQGVTELVLRGDYDAIYRRLDTMVQVIGVMESLRRQAGIVFPGDRPVK